MAAAERRPRTVRRRGAGEVVRRQATGHRCQSRGTARGRGHRVALDVRERGPRADGVPRRQPDVHIFGVRDRHGGRTADNKGRWPAAAPGHDAGRHRSEEHRFVHGQRLVFRLGGRHEVSVKKLALFGGRGLGGHCLLRSDRCLPP